MKRTHVMLFLFALSLLIPSGRTFADAPIPGDEREDKVECAEQNKACELVLMDSASYEDLYKRSIAGPIPVGPSHGAARWGIFGPNFLGAFWTGKHFREPDQDHPKHWLTNFVFIGDLVSAEVDYGESKADPSKQSIILDYSKSDNIAARLIRDEIRQVPGQPGVYIGYAYKYIPTLGWKRWLPFALDFNSAAPSPAR